MSETTPTPWGVVAMQGGAICIYGPSGDDGPWAVAEVSCVSDARLIVKAVNAYGPLVEALKRIGDQADSIWLIEEVEKALKDIGEDTP